MGIELNKRVRIVSKEAAAREGVNAGPGGMVISPSWKIPGGFLVECEDGVRHHFAASELKHDYKAPAGPKVIRECDECFKTVELDADDLDARLGGPFICDSCYEVRSRQDDTAATSMKPPKQNLAVLGMVPTRSKTTIGSTSAAGIEPDVRSRGAIPDENARRTLLIRLLDTPEIRSCTSEKERAAYVKKEIELKSLRATEKETGISKSDVSRLAAAFEAKAMKRMGALRRNPGAWSEEFRRVIGDLEELREPAEREDWDPRDNLYDELHGTETGEGALYTTETNDEE